MLLEEVVLRQVVDEISELENPPPLKNFPQAEFWWLGNALAGLTDGLADDEALFIRSRAFSMIRHGIRKLSIARLAADEAYLGFVGPVGTRDRTVLDTLSVGVIGSVAKLETEPASDLDLNYIFDNDTPAHREDIYADFARGVSLRIQAVVPEQAKDMRIFSFTTLQSEARGVLGDATHLPNILFEIRWIRITPDTQAFIDGLIGGLSREDVKHLVFRRREMAKKELGKIEAQVKERERFPKTGLYHHTTSWYIMGLAVAVGRQDIVKRPYWDIADELSSLVPSDFTDAEWSELRAGVIATIGIRESDFPAPMELSNAKDKLLKMRDVIGPKIDEFMAQP